MNAHAQPLNADDGRRYLRSRHPDSRSCIGKRKDRQAHKTCNHDISGSGRFLLGVCSRTSSCCQARPAGHQAWNAMENSRRHRQEYPGADYLVEDFEETK